MRLPVSLLLLGAIFQAVPSLSAGKTARNKSSKRELDEGLYGLKDGSYYKLVTVSDPSVYPDDEASESSEEQSQEPDQVYGFRVPQYSKISDVLSGEHGSYEAAVVNQLHSPLPIYKPKPTPLKISQEIPVQPTYGEHKHYKHHKTSKQNKAHVPREDEQHQYYYKNTQPDDHHQNSNQLRAETSFPRQEPRLFRPLPQNVLIQQPQYPEQLSRLLSQFGLHQYQPLQYTHENLKPVQYVQKQPLLQLVPAKPESHYKNQDQADDYYDEEENNYSDDYESHAQHGQNGNVRSYESTRPTHSSTAKPIKSSTVRHLPSSTARPTLPQSQKINEYHNIHPHGAVSHASYYTGEIDPNHQYEFRSHFSKLFSQQIHTTVSPKRDRHHKKYVPVTQSTTTYSPASSVPLRLSPKRNTVLPVEPSPQPHLLEEEPSLQYQEHSHEDQKSIQYDEEDQSQYEKEHKQEDGQYQQQNQQESLAPDQHHNDEYTETRQQSEEYKSRKQSLQYQQETEIQNVEEDETTTELKEQPYQSISELSQDQQTISPTQETFYTEAEPIKVSIISAPETSSNFNTVSDTSTVPTIESQTESTSSSTTSKKLSKFNRYTSAFKTRTSRPLLQRKPFYTRSTVVTTRKPISFSPYRRHITTKAYSSTPDIETSATLPATTSEAESTETISTLAITTTPTPEKVSFQDESESTATEPTTQTTEFQPVKLSTSSIFATQTSIPPLTDSASLSLSQSSSPIPQISEGELNPQSLFEPEKSELEEKSLPKTMSLSEPEEIFRPKFQIKKVRPQAFEPQHVTAVTKSSFKSKHFPRPDLPARPQPGVIYQMRSQPPPPSEPLLQPRASLKTPQLVEYQYESHSGPQNDYPPASPQIFILSTQQPMYKKSANDLYLTYFPVPTPSSTLLLQSASPLPRPQPHPESTIIPRPKPTVQPTVSTDPEEEPTTPSDSQEEPKRKSHKHKTRPQPSEVLIPHGHILTPVQPIFQPQIYSQPQEILLDQQHYEHADSPQLNAFPNVQYFGNFAENIFGEYSHKKR